MYTHITDFFETMSTRRLNVKAKKHSLNYIDISPSKQARRKSVSKRIINMQSLLPEVTGNSNGKHSDTESLGGTEDDLCLGEFSSESTVPSTDQYARKKEKTASAWLDIWKQMLAVAVESLSLPLTCECCTCGKKANCRCHDCGPLTFYCKECADHTHTSLVFHRIEIFKVCV